MKVSKVSIGSPLEGIPLIGNPLNVLSPGGNLIEGVGEITGHATVDLVEGRPIDAVTGIVEGVGNKLQEKSQRDNESRQEQSKKTGDRILSNVAYGV